MTKLIGTHHSFVDNIEHTEKTVELSRSIKHSYVGSCNWKIINIRLFLNDSYFLRGHFFGLFDWHCIRLYFNRRNQYIFFFLLSLIFRSII